MLNLAIFFLSYIIGSIPFSFTIAKLFKGMDIRKLGTKNVGAINIISVAGIFPGIITLLFDISKGALVVHLTNKITEDIGMSLTSGLFYCNWS